MAIRIEVTPDGNIEIMRTPVGGGPARFVEVEDEQKAYGIIRYLVRREIRAVRAERFVPEFEKECKQAQAELLERK